MAGSKTNYQCTKLFSLPYPGPPKRQSDCGRTLSQRLSEKTKINKTTNNPWDRCLWCGGHFWWAARAALLKMLGHLRLVVWTAAEASVGPRVTNALVQLPAPHTPPPQWCQRISPHPHSISLPPHHPARSPFATAGALRSLSSSFQISEAGGSQLHLRKLDGIFVALPVEPVNTLQRQRWSVGGHTFTSSPVVSLHCSRFTLQAIF